VCNSFCFRPCSPHDQCFFEAFEFLSLQTLICFLVIVGLAGLGDSGGPALVSEDVVEAYAFLVLGFDVSCNAKIH